MNNKRKFTHITVLEVIAVIYSAMIIGGLITVISAVITDGAPNFNLI